MIQTLTLNNQFCVHVLSSREWCIWLLYGFFVSDSSATPLARIEQFSVFESVQEITGALVIERRSPEFTNLSFFKNLRIIHGRELE